MKKKYFLPLFSLLVLTSCGNNTTFCKDVHLKNGEFKIINFADTQIDELSDLDNGSIICRTIENCISVNQPDLITFSGDNAWGGKVVKCYKKLCEYMDSFEIPYCFVYGNHDREHALASHLESIVKASKYGYIERGDAKDSSFGNYAINIRNDNDEIVHKLLMMDSRTYYTYTEKDYTYVENPVRGVSYGYINGKYFYGSSNYDTIRGNQIDWYKKIVNDGSIESTIITHMPIRQYYFAIEQYATAVRNNDSAKLAELDPIGNCAHYETVCCAAKDYGFFDTMKEIGSTKNFICGHDHCDDYSLMYDGIRLSYAVKTGDECYWDSTGNTNGCTVIKIDTSGEASISNYYINVLN